jgi:hypothetical protein
VPLLLELSDTGIVSGMRAGWCLGPEGNGVSLREGGEGGPGPLENREDK